MAKFGNRVKNLHLELVSVLPSNPKKGYVLVLETDNVLYYHNGTEWVALGKTKKITQLVGDGTAMTFTITHNFNTDAISVTAIEVATGEGVLVDYAVTDPNTVTLSFLEAPTTDQLKITVFG